MDTVRELVHSEDAMIARHARTLFNAAINTMIFRKAFYLHKGNTVFAAGQAAKPSIAWQTCFGIVHTVEMEGGDHGEIRVI